MQLTVPTQGHIPVFLDEAVAYLKIEKSGTYVDGTLGGAGHALAISRQLDSGGWLIGIDRDPEAIERARQKLNAVQARVTLVHDDFRNLAAILDDLGISAINGAVFDLGVSSYQLDDPYRGFSYQHPADLDMRMDPTRSLTAYDIVNKSSAAELSKILLEYGEERWSKRIAQFIISARERAPVTTTEQLTEIIKAAIPAAARREGPHPARRTFQALRIAVNDELEALRSGLNAAIEHLTVGGRIAVISFHSLEDRIVKETFLRAVRRCSCPVSFPVCVCGNKPILKLITRKPVLPSAEEVSLNPRSRSARLRVAERI